MPGACRRAKKSHALIRLRENPPGAERGDLVDGHAPYHDILEKPHEDLAMDRWFVSQE